MRTRRTAASWTELTFGSLLTKETRAGQGVQVASEARWTLNGFSNGYARALAKGGVLADYPEEGAYRTLLEGVESFVGLMVVTNEDTPLIGTT